MEAEIQNFKSRLNFFDLTLTRLKRSILGLNNHANGTTTPFKAYKNAYFRAVTQTFLKKK